MGCRAPIPVATPVGLAVLGDVQPSLTARMGIALNEVRQAQYDRDPAREIAWLSVMDRQLDVHIKLMQAAGTFRKLSQLDPELDARLSVRLSYRLIGGGVAATNLL